MKKSLYIFIVLLFSTLIYDHAAYALDFSGYLENEIQIVDYNGIIGANKLKLDLQMKSDTYYCLVTITGINNFGELSGNAIYLSRAYLDLYQSWGKATIGLQNLAWGSGYLFNLADLFNPINILDPKGEKDGVNALDAKWNMTDTARLEMAVLPGAGISETDYGVRYQFTVGGFEFTANALRKTIPAALPAIGQTARYAYILEGRGELGETAPGVWAQAGYFRDEPRGGEAGGYYSFVLGSDYTAAIGTGLYLLCEYLQSGRPGGHDQFYFTTRYTIDGYLTLSLAALRDIQNQADMCSLGWKYLINDNIEFSGAYYYYPRGGLMVGMPFDGNSDITLEIKIIF